MYVGMFITYVIICFIFNDHSDDMYTVLYVLYIFGKKIN